MLASICSADNSTGRYLCAMKSSRAASDRVRSADACRVQEKLLQRGISEKGIERGEAVERILGAEGSNTTRYTQLDCPNLLAHWSVLLLN